MPIDTSINTGSSTAGALTSAAGGSAASKVGFDTFLKLLTTQLKNQDPLNPLDGTQFTAQIAQFSQLEQQINSNNYLKTLSESRDYSIQAVATNYLGKEALVSGNKLTKDADTETFGYKLDKAASRVTIDIIDNASGTVVRTLEPAAGDKGIYKVTWDGKNTDGAVAANGNYSLRINAADAEGTKITAGLLTYGTVAEVTNENGQVGLILADGRQANFENSYGVRVVN